MQPPEIHHEMERARLDFHRLAGQASPAALRRRSSGTRWTNRQLLFHMVFGFIIVRSLQPLVHTLGRLGRSRKFAAVLNSVRRPFHVINYLGSVGGGRILTLPAMTRLREKHRSHCSVPLRTPTDAGLALRCISRPTGIRTSTPP